MFQEHREKRDPNVTVFSRNYMKLNDKPWSVAILLHEMKCVLRLWRIQTLIAYNVLTNKLVVDSMRGKTYWNPQINVQL